MGLVRDSTNAGRRARADHPRRPGLRLVRVEPPRTTLQLCHQERQEGNAVGQRSRRSVSATNHRERREARFSPLVSGWPDHRLLGGRDAEEERATREGSAAYARTPGSLAHPPGPREAVSGRRRERLAKTAHRRRPWRRPARLQPGRSPPALRYTPLPPRSSPLLDVDSVGARSADAPRSRDPLRPLARQRRVRPRWRASARAGQPPRIRRRRSPCRGRADPQRLRHASLHRRSPRWRGDTHHTRLRSRDRRSVLVTRRRQHLSADHREVVRPPVSFRSETLRIHAALDKR